MKKLDHIVYLQQTLTVLFLLSTSFIYGIEKDSTFKNSVTNVLPISNTDTSRVTTDSFHAIPYKVEVNLLCLKVKRNSAWVDSVPNIYETVLIVVNHPDDTLKSWLDRESKNLQLYFDNEVATEVTVNFFAKNDSSYQYTADLSAHGTNPLIHLPKDFCWHHNYQINLGSKVSGIPSGLREIQAQKFDFYKPLHKFSLYLGILLFASLILFYGYRILNNKKLILRNSRANPIETNANSLAGYSLAKTQLAFWTFLSLLAISYHYFIVGEFAVNTTILALIGISASTTGLGYLIDKKDQSQEEEGTVFRHQNQETKHFITDILSDENGLSIHRLQKFAFHILGAIIFITETLNGLTIADLDGNLLILMGVSSTTYLGLKNYENRNPDKNKRILTLKQEIEKIKKDIDIENAKISTMGNDAGHKKLLLDLDKKLKKKIAELKKVQD